MDASILALLLAGVAILPGLAALWQARKQKRAATELTDAETADTFSQAAERLVRTTENRMDRLELEIRQQTSQLNALRAQMKDVWKGITVLQTQVRKLGSVPDWPPHLET